MKTWSRAIKQHSFNACCAQIILNNVERVRNAALSNITFEMLQYGNAFLRLLPPLVFFIESSHKGRSVTFNSRQNILF